MMFAIFLEYDLAWCCNTLLGVSLEALKEYNYTPYNPEGRKVGSLKRRVADER